MFSKKPNHPGEFKMIIAPITTKRQAFGCLRNKQSNDEAKQPAMIIPIKPPVETEIKWMLPQSDLEARRIAGLVAEGEVDQMIDATTDHAMLVVLGHFAQTLAVVEKLAQVPLGQRQGANGPPQMKLIEFLVGILGGIEYLQELNLGSQPIVSDATIAKAWGQAVFGHYSQVSRTLAVADEETLAGVIDVLRAVSMPFLQTAVMETIKHSGRLVIDVDLTGRQVSPTSTDYDEAEFGWMDDGVSKGYQDAVTSLVCERWGRLMLTLQRYGGRTLSAECLQAAVREVEELLQVRPRRRVELLQRQRQEMVFQLEQRQVKLDHNQHQQKGLRTRIRAAKAEAKQHQQTVVRLEADYQAQGRKEGPHSQLAKMRRKWLAAQKREARGWRDLKKYQNRAARIHQQVNEMQAELLALDEWWAYLEADNMANPNPVSIVLRIDAGFSTGPNLAWLIEMGYTVLTKAHHNSSTDSLRRRLPTPIQWTRVGKNAEAVAMGHYYQNDCAYPLQAMLVRYHLPDKVRHTTLFYYDDIPPPDLPDWFSLYNARQTIEAGIKEGKGVFTLKRHLVRSPIGMKLQEQFALFGANFVRWAAAWVKDLLRQTNQNFSTALDQVKTLVRIVSRTRARWVRNATGSTLIFDDAGPFAGTIICLSGTIAIQLPLPLFNFYSQKTSPV
jgi:hypothetical protein